MQNMLTLAPATVRVF